MPRVKKQTVDYKRRLKLKKDREYNAKRRANTSSPQKISDETQLRKDRDRKREMRANLKEEGRDRIRQQISDAARLRRADLPDEELALLRQNDAERKRLKRAQMSDKEKALGRKASAECMRQRRGKLTEEDLEPQNSSRLAGLRSKLKERQLALKRIKSAASVRERRANLTAEEKAIQRQKDAARKRNYRSKLNEEQLAVHLIKVAARCKKYNQKLSEEQRILRRILGANRLKEKKINTIESNILLFKGQLVNGKEQNSLEGGTPDASQDRATKLQIRRLKTEVTSLKEAGIQLIKSCVTSSVGRFKGRKGLSKKATETSEKKQSDKNGKKVKHRKKDRKRHREIFPMLSIGDNKFVCIVCDEELDSLRAIKLHLTYHTASELSEAKEKYAQTIREDASKMQVVALTVYECEICSDKCYSPVVFRKHLVENHKENRELLKKMCFPCTLCPEAFVVNSALRTHQRILHNIFTQCPVCSESFENQELFAEHVEANHLDCVRDDEMILEYDDGYFCKLCGVSSRQYDYVATHLKEAHEKISFECEICKLKFATKRILVRHKGSFHQEKTFCCELCGGRFANAFNLRVHKRKHTANSATGVQTEEKIDCKLCGKVLANTATYRQHHMAVHQGNQFQCTVCQKSFKVRSMLYRHRITVCEKEKAIPKPCPICGKIMENFIALHIHKNNVHKYGNTEETVCHVCKKTFKTPDNLLSHNRRCHAPNKILGDENQKLSGSDNKESDVSKRIRPGENMKLPCSACTKTLKSKLKLLDHWRLKHRGEEPFKCSFCEMQFKCKYKFYLHKHSAHKNESAELIIDTEVDEKLIADFNEAHANLFDEPVKVSKTKRTVVSSTEKLTNRAKTNSSLSQPNDLSANEVIYNTDKRYVDFSRANIPVVSKAPQGRVEDNCDTHESISDENIPKTLFINKGNEDATVENKLMETDDELWEPFEFSSPMASPLPESDAVNSDTDIVEDRKPFVYWDGSDFKDPFPKRLTIEIERLKECLLCDEVFTSSSLHEKHLNSKGHRLALRTNKRETILIETKKEEHREKIGKEKDRKKIRKRSMGCSEKKELIPCPFCDKKLHGFYEYKKHTLKHKKKENCIICSEKFATVRRLVNHYNLEHNGENVIKCDNCDLGFLNTYSLREHIKNIHTTNKRVRNHKKWGKWTCDVCGENIKDVKLLKTHVLSHEYDKHKCVHCAAEFKALIEFEQHYKDAHNGEMPFSCGECHKKFATQLRLQQHEIKAHSKDKDVPGQARVEESLTVKRKHHEYNYANKKQLSCSFCDAVYYNKEKFTAHMVQHNKRAMCLLCPEGFANVRKLVYHYGEVHNGEKLVKCEICDTPFLEYQMRNLREHMTAQHDIARGLNWKAQKKYSCDVCGLIIEGKQIFTKHLASHKKEKHKCVHCKAELKGLEALEGHYNETHNGEMPFPCGECPLKFPIQRRLQLHQKASHPDSNDTQNDQFGDSNELVSHKTIHDPLEDTEKVFCEVCGKFFFGEASLTIHKREHTGENPYQCTVCGKAFFSPAHLKQHMNKDHKKVCHPCYTCGQSFNRRQNLLKHSKTCPVPTVGLVGGQTKFTCDICSENCGKPEALERHMKYHNPARRFVCEICSWRFKYSSNLSAHKKTVHQKKGIH